MSGTGGDRPCLFVPVDLAKLNPTQDSPNLIKPIVLLELQTQLTLQSAHVAPAP